MRAIFVKDITGTEWEEDKELGEDASHYGSKSPTHLYELPEPIYIYNTTHYDTKSGFVLRDLSGYGAKGKYKTEHASGEEIVCATKYFVLSYMGGKLQAITWKPGEQSRCDVACGIKKSRAKKYAEWYRVRDTAPTMVVNFHGWTVNVFPAYPDGRCICLGSHIGHFLHAETKEEATKMALDAIEEYAKESEPTFLFD